VLICFGNKVGECKKQNALETGYLEKGKYDWKELLKYLRSLVRFLTIRENHSLSVLFSSSLPLFVLVCLPVVSTTQQPNTSFCFYCEFIVDMTTQLRVLN
jgi:hypothetical protein